MLWKDMYNWIVHDPPLSTACLQKQNLLTWYLSQRHILLALFSSKVSSETKIAIVKVMKQNLSLFEAKSFTRPEQLHVYKDSTL